MTETGECHLSGVRDGAWTVQSDYRRHVKGPGQAAEELWGGCLHPERRGRPEQSCRGVCHSLIPSHVNDLFDLMEL